MTLNKNIQKQWKRSLKSPDLLIHHFLEFLPYMGSDDWCEIFTSQPSVVPQLLDQLDLAERCFISPLRSSLYEPQAQGVFETVFQFAGYHTHIPPVLVIRPSTCWFGHIFLTRHGLLIQAQKNASALKSGNTSRPKTFKNISINWLLASSFQMNTSRGFFKEVEELQYWVPELLSSSDDFLTKFMELSPPWEGATHSVMSEKTMQMWTYWQTSAQKEYLSRQTLSPSTAPVAKAKKL